MRRTILLFLPVIMLILALPQANVTAGTIHPSLLGPSRVVLCGDSVDVWVTFKDRGFASPQALDQALRQAERSLLPHTKARRAKMNRASLVGQTDLPVNTTYAHQVLSLGARYRTVSRTINALSVRLPRTLLNAVAALPFVDKVQPVAVTWRDPDLGWPNGLGENLPQIDETDLLNYGNSYDQLNQINVVAAHNAGWNGLGVIVGMLDTGWFRQHQSLVNQPVIAWYDFINNDTTVTQQPGDPPGQSDHGTYTWSTLGGAYSSQLYGPAYGSQFILGKTEDVGGENPIEEDYYVAGLEWEDSLGADVVSTSLGYIDWYQWSDMNGLTAVTTIGVNQAVANGICCVTAAGNENGSAWNHIIAPADAFGVITCGAVSSTGQIASFSSHGPTYDGRMKPEVCARGVSTWCALPSGVSAYGGVSGTSLSTPLVGGCAAIVLQAHPNWTPQQVRLAMMNTASNHTSPNNTYGWGIINVMSAIAYNFPPAILQPSPHAGPLAVPVDSIVGFNVIVMDSLGGELTCHWLVDGNEIVSGPQTSFSYQWSQPTTSLVKCVVINQYGGSDSTSWNVEVYGPAGVIDPAPGAPTAYALHGVYPNPFNPSTTISYELRAAGYVSLNVYDTAGRAVATLVHGQQQTGSHQAIFDASGLPAGVYLARLSAGSFNAAVKLVLVK